MNSKRASNLIPGHLLRAHLTMVHTNVQMPRFTVGGIALRAIGTHGIEEGQAT